MESSAAWLARGAVQLSVLHAWRDLAHTELHVLRAWANFAQSLLERGTAAERNFWAYQYHVRSWLRQQARAALADGSIQLQ